MSHGGPPFFPLPIQVFSGFKHITDEKNGLRDILNELYGLASGGGGEDLAATLAIGNTMGAGQRIAGPVSEDMNLVPDAGYGFAIGDPALALAGQPGSFVSQHGAGIMRTVTNSEFAGGCSVFGKVRRATSVAEAEGGGNFLNCYSSGLNTTTTLGGYGNMASVFNQTGALDATPAGFDYAGGTLFLGHMRDGDSFTAGGYGGKIVGGKANNGRSVRMQADVGITMGLDLLNYYGNRSLMMGFNIENQACYNSLQIGSYHFGYYSYGLVQLGARHYAYAYYGMQFGTGHYMGGDQGFRMFANCQIGGYNYMYVRQSQAAQVGYGHRNKPVNYASNRSFQTGYGGYAQHPQEREHAGGRWRTNSAFGGDAPQLSEVIVQAQTTDATPTVCEIRSKFSTNFNGPAFVRYLIRDETALGCLIEILAFSNNGLIAGHFIRQAVVKRTGGVSSLVGSVTVIGTDENAGGLAVAITVDDPTDQLRVTVTGLAETAIQWMATIRAQRVTLT